jgi:hypothetical protein
MQTKNLRIVKPSLIDLISNDNWMEIEPSHGGRLTNAWDKTVASFNASKGVGTTVDQIKLVIGRHILEQLGWEVGNRVCIYHNPDYLTQIKLIKSDNNSGYKLTTINNSKNAIINFRWRHIEVPLNQERNKSVEHVIFKKILLVDLNEEKKD